MAPPGAQRFREVLTPLASRYGLDYGVEILGHGEDRPEAKAFGFLPAGAALLDLYVEPDDFPAEARRTRRRAAKWLAKSFRTPNAQRAVVLLTHAMGLYLAENMRRAGEQPSADGHLGLLDLVAQHYPAGDPERAELSAAYDRAPEPRDGARCPDRRRADGR